MDSQPSNLDSEKQPRRKKKKQLKDLCNELDALRKKAMQCLNPNSTRGGKKEKLSDKDHNCFKTPVTP